MKFVWKMAMDIEIGNETEKGFATKIVKKHSDYVPTETVICIRWQHVDSKLNVTETWSSYAPTTHIATFDRSEEAVD